MHAEAALLERPFACEQRGEVIAPAIVTESVPAADLFSAVSLGPDFLGDDATSPPLYLVVSE